MGMARALPEASDAELIYSLRAGQPQALKLLYERYGKLVYTVASRILNNASEAEDLTQDVFLTFWKSKSFDPDRGALSSYLGMLTRSRAINKLQTQSSRQRAVERFQNLTPTLFVKPTPLEQASLNEQETAVREAIAQLTDAQQQILRMNYYEGLSQSQIAQQLNLPLGTVKTHARQGMIKLRQLLHDQID